jgi:hypothetical protein
VPHRRIFHRIVALFVIVSLLSSTLAPIAHAQDAGPGQVFLPVVAGGQGADPVIDLPSSNALFRTRVAVSQSSRWADLDALRVTLLERGDDWALLLVDDEQLATLARRGFQPRASDEFSALVAGNAGERAWLAASLQPMLAQMAALQSDLSAADASQQAAARAALRDLAQAMTFEVRAAVADLDGLDADGDGLTNTEEGWWCTDAGNPNSDGDVQGYTDGQEVHALLDVTLPRTVRWGYGPPFGPPAAWPNFNNRDGTGLKVCNDGDKDTIPDYAEVYMVGTRVPEESTDHDKFDDGQELFGTTFCPGDAPNPCWGTLPAGEYWNFIKASMPNWVLPPGDSPFVAAFPVPEVYVEAGSWHVERVTTITTSEGQMTEISESYETSVTRGESTSIADTVTWNNWEEVSEAVEQPLGAAQVGGKEWAIPIILSVARTFGLRVAGGVVARQVSGFLVRKGIAELGKQVAIGIVGNAAYDVLKDTLLGDESKDDVQNQYPVNIYNSSSSSANASATASAEASAIVNNNIDFQGVVGALDSVQYAINRQGELLARGLQDVSYAISQPRLTETRTNGRSWGGAQTTTHEVYEEHTISEGEAFTTGQNWSTAWAVDSSHAADLTFNYTVQNSGTEYARELTNLVFNIYIGDDKLPSITYPAWQQFANGKLENLFPVWPNTPPGMGSSKTFASTDIPLSLDQMKRIDLGERLTVKVESYSYGADELFYADAVTGGVTVFVEDGVEDGDETVDQYVIPTWGVESVQDVLTRYFPHDEDEDGNLNSLWTPEFNGVNQPAWNEHFLSDIAWWNIYLTQGDAGDTPLKDLPAQAGSGVLFRFNRDSDRDGYNDRAEVRYYCALPEAHPDRSHCADGHLRPEIHPQPEVSAGYVARRTGNLVTVTLALENSGTFDAYGIDAVMYSPDATTTIGNNTVGGNGKVRPGNHVAVGSMIKPPDFDNWGNSTAKPYAGGSYAGDADRTYTFTAGQPGVVGSGSTSVNWSDGVNNGVIALGSSYHAPLPVDLNHGLQVGFNTGTVAANTSFTVQALSPRDTFTYTVNSDPFTPPVIVVSYSDPQGSHRFVTPVLLTKLSDSLAPHSGEMLKGIAVQVVATAPFDPAGVNTTNLVINNPHPALIVGCHLHLNFVSDGKLVLEKSFTLDIPAGPTVFAADWSATEFSADYNPTGDNLLIAFWTDSENNIIDSAARPFNSFAADPTPTFVMVDANVTWNFGTAAQGTLLKRSFTFANTGSLDLLTYVSAPAGLTVSQTGSRRVGMADMTTYEMALNTANLSVGPYTSDITIRTSDPEARERTVRVTGIVTAVPADTPVGPVQRPLDWPATVSGTQGQWVEFTHTLGPEPQSLHPVKLYTQDYSTLKGVGRYAMPFNQGTASYEMFGDGRDGVMPSSGNLDNNNGVGVGVVNGSQGSSSINVTGGRSVSRINPGDIVLIHQTQGANAGCWEFNRAVSDFGDGTSTYQLAIPLQCNYVSGGNNNHAQIQRVPQYTDCPATGTITPIEPWNGSWGGIVAVMCSGTMNLTGSIDSSGSGFRGGPGGTGNVTCTGYSGESYSGPSTVICTPNSGGGGAGPDHKIGVYDAVGGGGGGYGNAGGNGGNKGTGGGTNPGSGIGGNPYGSLSLTSVFFGSGGGGGGGRGGQGGVGGVGGNGGGLIIISARQMNIQGYVRAIGGNGVQGYSGSDNGGAGGGGGGSGGSVILRANNAALSDGRVLATNGNGGSISVFGGAGGIGGAGRIRIDYCTSLSGSTNPTANPIGQKFSIS